MSKKFIFCLFSCYAVLVIADDNSSIIQQADSFRLPKGAARVETTIKYFRENELNKERFYTVYIKPSRRSLVLMKSPMEIGQKVLMLNDKFWLLTPDSQRPLRITASQKLLGEASTGDIANMTWGDDYTVQKVAPVDCPKLQIAPTQIDIHAFNKFSSCLKLDLVEKTEGLTYSTIELFTDKNTHFPVKADLFVSSGKKAKEAWFAKLGNGKEKYIDTMILNDNIQTTRNTIVTYKSIETFEFPDEFLNPAALVRNALPGY